MEISVAWDSEASVWIAECEKLGLVLESGSYDALIERLKNTIPEQLELNGITGEKYFVICTKDRRMVCA